MKGFTLTAEELQELRVAHKLSRDKRHAYRINVVVLLGTGWSIEEVSEALLIDDETVRSYVKNYRAGGLPKLLEINHKGSTAKLTEEQIEQLSIELDNQVYLCTQSIREYIRHEFHINYTISGLTDLLHRLDYVYKKPKLSPANPDLDAQEVFLKEFMNFMTNKPDDVAVFFADAVHAVHNTLAGYGWIKRGKDKLIQSNSGRSRLNIHGAMNAETFETVTVSSEENINADSTIQLFQYLEELYPLASIIYVVLDNAKYHFSKPVQEYLKTSRVKVAFLPAYSPELNLIERLWRVFKKNVLYNRFYETFADFKRACEAFFENQDKYHDEIASVMGAGLEALAE